MEMLDLRLLNWLQNRLASFPASDRMSVPVQKAQPAHVRMLNLRLDNRIFASLMRHVLQDFVPIQVVHGSCTGRSDRRFSVDRIYR